MFKRANKITALLVAAASIMSVVPAMASERLGTKDGTLNYGIAAADGKYIYDGYRTDDDNTGIYFNGGDKDKLVDDLEDYNIDGVNSKYGSKYVLAKDGNDEYLVDLSTGKVLDNETDEEKRDDVTGSLRSKLKKTDRYSLTDKFDDVTVGERLFAGNKQFGEVWYMYSAKGDTTYATTQGAVQPSVSIVVPTKESAVQTAIENGTTVKVFGTEILSTSYTTLSTFEAKVKAILDAKLGAGTYTYTKGEVTITKLDADTITGALSDSQFTTLKNKLKTVSGDAKATYYQGAEENAKGSDIQYGGFVNADGKYIDASNLANIYAYSKEAEKVVKIEEYNDYNKDNKIKVDLIAINPIAQDKDYIYTITKAKISQGSEADVNAGTNTRDAYFYQKISKAQGDKKDDAYIPKTVESYEVDNKSFYDDGDAQDAYKAIIVDDDGYEVENNMYTVKNGVLYVVRVKSDKVKVFKMKTKKAKVDPMDAVVTAGNSVDKKLDAPLLQKDGDSDHDIFDGSGKAAVSLDVDGNIWALDKGAIYKVDGTDFKEVYTLDRSIDNLDVYNDGSLIAWEHDGKNDGDVYTTVTEGKAVTNTEAPAATPAKVGWDKLADGTWNFYDATGAKVVNNWANAGGVWYYLKADGVMATGWENVGGTWYYLASSGAMATGWQNVGGTWYLLASSGAMKTGWVNENGTWYYLNANGSMAANTTVDGYVLNGSGAWVK